VRQRARLAGSPVRRLLQQSSLAVTFDAVDEEPNVVVTSRRPPVGRCVGLACPRGSGGCAGVLRLSDPRGRVPLAAARYGLAAGRRGVV